MHPDDLRGKHFLAEQRISLRGTTEMYKGKDLYSLVFQKEFTEICGCWAVRNCVCSSVICTDFIVPDVKSFSYHELDPVL